MSPRTKLIVGFSALFMVGAGCIADDTVATGDKTNPVIEGTGGSGPDARGSGSGGGSGGSGPDARDARGGGSGGAPVVGDPRCCPRDTERSGCMHLGGSNTNANSCKAICDFWCSENWRVEKDENGCEGWRFEIRKPAAGEDLHCSANQGPSSSVDARGSQDATDARGSRDARDAGPASEQDADDPGSDDPGTDDEQDAF